MMSQRITRVDNEEELVEAFKVSFTVMSDQGGMTPNLRKWEGKVCPHTHTRLRAQLCCINIKSIAVLGKKITNL